MSGFLKSAVVLAGMATLFGAFAVHANAQDAASTTFDVSRLDGSVTRSATLQQLGREGLQVEQEGTKTLIPLAELELARRSSGVPEPDLPFSASVVLQNGSVLGATSVEIARRTVTAVTPFATLSLPVAEVRSLRLAAVDDKLEASWKEIASRETKNDLLVVRKGEVLDFVAGVVGDVTAKDVKLLVREREVPVPRERVYGVVYVPRPEPGAAICEVVLSAGDRIRFAEAQLESGQLTGQIGPTTRISLPLEGVAELDFTLGKVKALADLPMTENQFAKTPLLTSAVFQVRKNRNALGAVLKIGDREFPKGLWIHSGTSATFRLGREYRKLTATLGLDSNSPELSRVAPRLRVVISGDGKVLDSRDLAWDDPGQSLDLDVSGVRELEIRVEPPREMPGVLEHLVLGEARVIK